MKKKLKLKIKLILLHNLLKLDCKLFKSFPSRNFKEQKKKSLQHMKQIRRIFKENKIKQNQLNL